MIRPGKASKFVSGEVKLNCIRFKFLSQSPGQTGIVRFPRDLLNPLLLLRYAAMRMNRVRHSRHEPIQDRGRRTRQKVLYAARKILVRRGYEQARVEEITRLARVGYGTFYKYFHNKQDVLEAVMEEVYAQLTEAG